MAKHTPGPWYVYVRPFDASTMVVAEGLAIGVAVVTDYAGLPAEANARLIAAAPDLLAACKGAVALRRKCSVAEATAALDACAAAIAKAEGGAP